MKNRRSQRGVALVITLILLAIITIVAVLFLGIARRNRAGVSLRASQTDAEFAAEAALQRAKADVVAQIISRGQLLGFDLTVSHGFDFPNNTGYRTDRPLIDPTGDKVWPYQYGPVMVDTNRGNGTAALEPRFFLDLNRNGLFESNSIAEGVIGDPEWIFVPDKPGQPYGPNNKFIARYSYIVVPSGLALDLNTIHNSAHPVTSAGSTGFLRNQGVGSFELNLAALLHETHSNIWTYSYGPALDPVSSGSAFDDALAFVSYRTNAALLPNGARSPISLLSLGQLFGPAATVLQTNGVDDLADDIPNGGLLFGADSIPDDLTRPYPGAPALRNFFTPQDLFDPNKTSVDFTNNLVRALQGGGTGTNANAYRYYDLVAQLATDTGDESRRRINLNWANLNGHSASTLTSWDNATNKDLALIFFTNAAQRVLNTMRAEFQPVTNVNMIMVAPTNYYTNSVHRIMQLTANIFDAARTNEFPSVFRPLFGNLGTTNLYIVGWTNDNNIGTLGDWLLSNTNGVPLVVGAKRGLPNFNEYTFRTDALVTRKLQLKRPDTNSLPTVTNQMYIMGLSNVVGVESWNSYMSPFPYASILEVTNTVTVTFTNNTGRMQIPPATFVVGVRTNVPAWNGRLTKPDQGFILPLLTNLVVMSNAVYRYRDDVFEGLGTNLFEDSATLSDPYYFPAWNLTISNHLVYIHRIETNLIDFVVLQDRTTIALTNLLKSAPSPTTQFGSVWGVARPPQGGISAQIAFSRTTGTAGEWQEYSAFTGDRTRAAQKFNDFMLARPTAPLEMETPFNPIARLIRIASWQANDPLVHYHVGDLTAYHSNTNVQAVKWQEKNLNFDPSSLTNINKAYAPWGTVGTLRSGGDPNSINHMARDPGVNESDRWEFPTNKFASVGWLGRVHRGTPWQTVYFKAGGATRAQWLSQSGMLLNHPTNDWRLVDIFTAALTDSGSRGLLSINQRRLGAWSAALSGVAMLTNMLDDDTVGSQAVRQNYEARLIDPARGDTNTPLGIVWNAVQQERIRRGGVFSDFSQLLAIPELTTASPFLNTSARQREFGLDDFAYERLPQQILGLLRLGQSRFVVYAYGQALKPERVNPATGLVDNYQITAEFATRTVMRVEGSARQPRVIVESFNILPPE